MIEHELDIRTADGAMNTFITHPEEGGPFPVVLFYMDAPGKREELHDMARRIPTVGYYVVLPNLYCRKAREFRGELYFGCAETDKCAPREMIGRLEAHLRTSAIWRESRGQLTRPRR
jgi:dienelactone hydrolase